VAKYCDEYVCMCVYLSVCVSVCMSARITEEPHAQSLPIFLRMLSMAVARSSSGRVMKSQGEWAILGVFFPNDNALYSIAFGSHTERAEPIEMPFGVMTRLGRRHHV